MLNCDQTFGNTSSIGGHCTSSISHELNSRYDVPTDAFGHTSSTGGHCNNSISHELNNKYEVPTNAFNTISVIHSNCQSTMNKRSEINDLIDSLKPSILALTEFGASAAVPDCELGIEGYTLYRGNHSDGGGGLGRGAALYVADVLNHSACPLFDDAEFDCSVWSEIRLGSNKSLHVGVVYRSPKSACLNNQRLMAIMERAAAARHSHLMICGDFNLPRIDWENHQSTDAEGSFTSLFMDCIDNLGLYQHEGNSTRFRNTQNSCLDLVFTNEESMINEIEELPPLGKSDHICQKWELIVSEVMFRKQQTQRFNYKRADWKSMKSEMRNFQLEPDDSPTAMNSKLIQFIDDLKSRHVPQCRPPNRRHRLPWMRSAKLKSQRLEKWRCWQRFKASGLPRDYDAYKMEQNRLGDMIRTAKVGYEQNLIADMRTHPNLFHGHCQRSLKTSRESLMLLMKTEF